MVSPLNDPPEATSKKLRFGVEVGEAVVELNATDVDDDEPTNRYTYVPSTWTDNQYSKITTWPRFGDLYQMDLDDRIGELISRPSDGVASTVTSFATEVLRYSSTWSPCSIECPKVSGREVCAATSSRRLPVLLLVSPARLQTLQTHAAVELRCRPLSHSVVRVSQPCVIIKILITS